MAENDIRGANGALGHDNDRWRPINFPLALGVGNAGYTA